MDETQIKELMGAVTELRETVEKSKTDALDDVKIKKIDDFLDKGEEINQKLLLEQERSKGMEVQIAELEKSISRKSETKNADEWKSSPEWLALKAFHLNNGQIHDSEMSLALKTMTEGTDSEGGYMVPTPLDNNIRKEIIEVSPMRSICTTRSMSAKTLNVPIRTTIPQASWKNEAVAADLSQSVYDEKIVTNHRLTVTVPTTRDLMQDAAFNVEAEITSDVALSFAQKEGLAFIAGTGDANFQPEGFLVDTALQAAARPTGGVGVVSADDLIDLQGDLKVGYDGMYVFNLGTLKTLRKLKDAQGQYLWGPAMSAGEPATFAGKRYAVMQDMPAIANGAFPIAYADFRKGYEIYDRTGMSVIYNPYSQDREQIVRWTFAKWLTGKVIMPEAFKLLEVSAA